MNLLFDPAAYPALVQLLVRVFDWLMVALPAVIALAGYASLSYRSDDPIRAWVQVITGALLAVWMLLPWHPTELAVRGANGSMTIFAFGYLLWDWLREAWRSGLIPRWAHLLVLATLAICAATAAWIALLVL